MSQTNKLILTLLAVGGVAWFAASLDAVLAPFVFAAVIAYISAPLAQRLEDRRVPPPLAALLIVALLLLLLVTLPLTLLPLVAAQVREFSSLLPLLVQKMQEQFGNDLGTWLTQQELGAGALGSLDGGSINKFVGLTANLFSDGLAFLSSFFTILLITPMAVFYFLRDRKSIGGELAEFLPPHIRGQAFVLIRDLDSVLGEFLHGQLIVMTIMAAFYSIVLSIADLPFALTIGIISGVLTFIPYVGFILGVLLATLVGIGNFESFVDIVIVWVLMGIGTLMESVLITPRFVGERVGLHPLMVLLAIMVMGDLFGFIGILAALPIASVVLVCARHLRRRYIGSDFYGRQ